MRVPTFRGRSGCADDVGRRIQVGFADGEVDDRLACGLQFQDLLLGNDACRRFQRDHAFRKPDRHLTSPPQKDFDERQANVD